MTEAHPVLVDLLALLAERLDAIESRLSPPAALSTASTEERFLAEIAARGMWMTGDGRVGECDAAALIGWTSDSLRNARSEGAGPDWYRLGGAGHRVTYRVSDIAEWIDSRRRKDC